MLFSVFCFCSFCFRLELEKELHPPKKTPIPLGRSPTRFRYDITPLFGAGLILLFYLNMIAARDLPDPRKPFRTFAFAIFVISPVLGGIITINKVLFAFYGEPRA